MKNSFTEVSQNSGRKSTRCFFFTERKRKENLKRFPQTFKNMDRLKWLLLYLLHRAFASNSAPLWHWRRITLTPPSSCTNKIILATNLEKFTFRYLIYSGIPLASEWIARSHCTIAFSCIVYHKSSRIIATAGSIPTAE